jgi:hypothetical protein
VVKAKIYVEGGGDSKEQHARCREGFSKLIEKAGFRGRMPRIIAGGGRESTYDRFKTATAAGAQAAYPMLLVDSEDPVPEEETVPDSAVAWGHLKSRDNWDRPTSVKNDQAQLMVTCMETWIMADRAALHTIFGASLRTNALLPQNGLEARPRQDVHNALENATRDCGREKAYRKGARSFQVLAQLNPETLNQHLPYFRRFIITLDRYL